MIVTNIGRGGVGLATKEKLEIGSIVSFAVQLPGLGNAIHIQARVLWTRQYLEPLAASSYTFLRVTF